MRPARTICASMVEGNVPAKCYMQFLYVTFNRVQYPISKIDAKTRIRRAKLLNWARKSLLNRVREGLTILA